MLFEKMVFLVFVLNRYCFDRYMFRRGGKLVNKEKFYKKYNVVCIFVLIIYLIFLKGVVI